MADEWQREERGGRGERTQERIKKRAEQPAVQTRESIDFDNRAAWPIKGLAPGEKTETKYEASLENSRRQENYKAIINEVSGHGSKR